jgi:hypothetical protein
VTAHNVFVVVLMRVTGICRALLHDFVYVAWRQLTEVDRDWQTLSRGMNLALS